MIDYYDAVRLNGGFQVKQIRDLEALQHLPEKEIRLVGLSRLDCLCEILLEAGNTE